MTFQKYIFARAVGKHEELLSNSNANVHTLADSHSEHLYRKGKPLELEREVEIRVSTD